MSLLASGATEGKVTAGLLGAYLKRTDPAFSPSVYGHSGLVDMIKTYDLLTAVMEPGGHWMVGIAAKEDQPELSTHGT
ncbi:OST-HTH/LOTUS domain protein [compost metagenome]